MFLRIYHYLCKSLQIIFLGKETQYFMFLETSTCRLKHWFHSCSQKILTEVGISSKFYLEANKALTELADSP